MSGLITPTRIHAATDTELVATFNAIVAEQHRRALDNNDIDALIADAFTTEFANNVPSQPWIHDGLLFCPGTINYRSKTSHNCTFVSLNNEWVWDSPDLLTDKTKDVAGPKRIRHSLSVVLAREGLEVDVVSSTSRANGPCQMKRVVSYQIIDGELSQTSTRSRKAFNLAH